MRKSLYLGEFMMTQQEIKIKLSSKTGTTNLTQVK